MHCIIGNFLYGRNRARHRASGTINQLSSDLADVKALLMSWLNPSFNGNI